MRDEYAEYINGLRLRLFTDRRGDVSSDFGKLCGVSNKQDRQTFFLD